jgi:hypothetical protein
MVALALDRMFNHKEKGRLEYIITRADGGILLLPSDDEMQEMFNRIARKTIPVGEFQVVRRGEKECAVIIPPGLPAWVKSHLLSELEDLVE